MASLITNFLDEFNETFYETTRNVGFFLSDDETQKENRVFQSFFDFVSKQFINTANNYAEVIFSLVNKFIKSDNK